MSVLFPGDLVVCITPPCYCWQPLMCGLLCQIVVVVVDSHLRVCADLSSSSLLTRTNYTKVRIGESSGSLWNVVEFYVFFQIEFLILGYRPAIPPWQLRSRGRYHKQLNLPVKSVTLQTNGAVYNAVGRPKAIYCVSYTRWRHTFSVNFLELYVREKSQNFMERVWWNGTTVITTTTNTVLITIYVVICA